MKLALAAVAVSCLFAASPRSVAQTDITGDPLCFGPTCWPTVINTVNNPGITVAWHRSIAGDSSGDDCGPCVPCGAELQVTVGSGSFLMCDERPDSELEPPAAPARCVVTTRNSGTPYYPTIRNNCGAAAYTNTDMSALSIYDQVGPDWKSQGEVLVGCECFSE